MQHIHSSQPSLHWPSDHFVIMCQLSLP
jgi:hypothetical protein